MTAPDKTSTGKDWLICAIIVIALAPAYLCRLYDIPWEVNTDETVIIETMRTCTQDSFDPFGFSNYFGFPKLVFIAYGQLAQCLGGVDFQQVRMAHALTGLLSVALIYAFAKLVTQRRWVAATAAVFAGVNHSFLALSRMAMRDNSGVMIETLALVVLLKGLLANSPLLSFLGGLACGLTFYVYYAARITLVDWLLFCAIFAHRQMAIKRLLKLQACALLGVAVTAGPLFINAFLDKTGCGESGMHQSKAMLFSADGSKLQMDLWHEPSIFDAVVHNIIRGLGAYNIPAPDGSAIYWHQGFATVDPLTGILLWVGVVYAFTKRAELRNQYLLFGFLFRFLTLALLVNRAPDYTRMTIALPHMATLAALGTFWLRDLLIARTTLAKLIPASLAVLIVGCNAYILWDWVDKSFAEVYIRNYRGVGETGRYIFEHGNRHLAMVWDSQNPYYTWGEKQWWQVWMKAFAAPGTRIDMISPAVLIIKLAHTPVTVFVSDGSWRAQQKAVLAAFPDSRVVPISKDGTRLAIERD